ncbi:hypothetical protein Peur_028350 [Populus x canadensis]
MVIIVGNSLNRNQWEPLACLLHSAYLLLELILMEAVSISSSKHRETQARNGSRVLRLLDKLSPLAQKCRGDDAMVFNSGHDLVVYSGKLKP